MNKKSVFVVIFIMLLSVPALAQELATWQQLIKKSQDAFREERNNDKAVLYAKEAVDAAIKECGENDLNVNSALENLKTYLFFAKRLDEAEPYIQHMIKIMEVNYGKDSSRVTTKMVELAENHERVGRVDDAKGLWEEILARRKREFGEDSVDATYSMCKAAKFYASIKEYDKAEKLNEKAIDILEKNHEYTRLSTHYLDMAREFDKEHKYEKEIEVLKKSIKILSSQGNDPALIMESYSMIAEAYIASGDIESARSYCFEGMTTLGDGMDHFAEDTFFNIINKIGERYVDRKELQKAKDMYNELLDIMKKKDINYANNATYCLILSLLGDILMGEGSLEEALGCYNEALRSNTSWADSEMIEKKRRDILQKLGKDEDAETSLRETIQKIEEQRGPGDKDVLARKVELQMSYEGKGDMDKVYEVFLEIVKGYKLSGLITEDKGYFYILSTTNRINAKDERKTAVKLLQYYLDEAMTMCDVLPDRFSYLMDKLFEWNMAFGNLEQNIPIGEEFIKMADEEGGFSSFVLKKKYYDELAKIYRNLGNKEKADEMKRLGEESMRALKDAGGDEPKKQDDVYDRAEKKPSEPKQPVLAPAAEEEMTGERVQELEAAAKKADEDYGAENIETAKAHEKLGDAYDIAGKFSEAIEVFKKAYEIRSAIQGPEHVDALETIRRLGYMYFRNHMYEESYASFQKIIGARDTSAEPDNKVFFRAMNDCVDVCRDMKRYDEAMTLGEKRVEMYQTQIDIDYYGYFDALEDLAFDYAQAGKYDEANTMYERASEICGNLKDTAYHYAQILNGQGLICIEKREFETAIKYITKAMNIFIEERGENDNNVAIMLSNLGRIEVKKGDYEKAIEYFMKQLAIYEKTHADDKSLSMVLSDISDAYWKMGKEDKAKEFSERATQYYEDVKDQDLDTLISLKNQEGLVASDNGENRKAIGLYKEALVLAEKKYGVNHPETTTYMSNIAFQYYESGQYDKAEELFLHVIDIETCAYGEFGKDLWSDYQNLALVYEEKEDFTNAMLYVNKALTCVEKNEGVESHRYANSLGILARFYRHLKRFPEAEPLYKKVIKLRDKTIGPVHYRTLFTIGDFIEFYKITGQFNEAIDWMEERIDRLLKAEPLEYGTIARAYNEIAEYYLFLGDLDSSVSQRKAHIDFMLQQKDRTAEWWSGIIGAYSRLASDYAVMHHYKKSITVYDEAIELAQTNKDEGEAIIVALYLAKASMEMEDQQYPETADDRIVQQNDNKIIIEEYPTLFGCPHGIRKKYYEDGTLKTEEPMYLGFSHGIRRSYYKNGKLHEEMPMFYGMRHGIARQYYPNGKLACVYTFYNGVSDGYAAYFHPNGALRASGEYDEGKQEGIIVQFYDNGKTAMEGQYSKGKPEGVWKIFYEDGTLKTEIPYKDGKTDGTVKEYGKDGKCVSDMDYKEGVMKSGVSHPRTNADEAENIYSYGDSIPIKEGVKKIEYDEGHMSSETEFKDWMQHGAAKLFYYYGEPCGELTFKCNEPDGEIVFYYDNGNVWGKAAYAKGEESADSSIYYENGKLFVDVSSAGKDQEKIDVYYWNGNRCSLITSNVGEKNVVTYHPNGKLKVEASKTQYRQFYDNGICGSEIDFTVSRTQCFDREGVLKYEFMLSEGIPMAMKRFDDKGEIVQEVRLVQ